ncbi:hypothetical protein [Vibrio owensii]|uniref:hypothetical protein n=1 Tax=Vibrio owensii TaxID=696485 RepID=UPI003CE463AF
MNQDNPVKAIQLDGDLLTTEEIDALLAEWPPIPLTLNTIGVGFNLWSEEEDLHDTIGQEVKEPPITRHPFVAGVIFTVRIERRTYHSAYYTRDISFYQESEAIEYMDSRCKALNDAGYIDHGSTTREREFYNPQTCKTAILSITPVDVNAYE